MNNRPQSIKETCETGLEASSRNLGSSNVDIQGAESDEYLDVASEHEGVQAKQNTHRPLIQKDAFELSKKVKRTNLGKKILHDLPKTPKSDRKTSGPVNRDEIQSGQNSGRILKRFLNTTYKPSNTSSMSNLQSHNTSLRTPEHECININNKHIRSKIHIKPADISVSLSVTNNINSLALETLDCKVISPASINLSSISKYHASSTLRDELSDASCKQIKADNTLSHAPSTTSLKLVLHEADKTPESKIKKVDINLSNNKFMTEKVFNDQSANHSSENLLKFDTISSIEKNMKKQRILMVLDDPSLLKSNKVGRSRSPEENNLHIKGLLEKGQAIKRNNAKLVQEKQLIEKQECPFQPQTRKNSPNEGRRSLKQFLKGQKQFEDQKKARNMKLQEEAEKVKVQRESLSPPQILEKSRKIVEENRAKEKDNRTPHERLYDLSRVAHGQNTRRNSSMSFLENEEPQQFEFEKRRTTLAYQLGAQDSGKHQRRGKVDEILYNDALRRVRKGIITQKRKDNEAKEYRTFVNSSSNKMLAERLIREFEEESSRFFEVNKEHKFNYIQIGEFMRNLKFLAHAEDTKNEHFVRERTLLYDMWLVLRGDELLGVNERNLLLFLLAIMEFNFELPPYIPHHADNDSARKQNDDHKGSPHPSEQNRNRYSSPYWQQNERPSPNSNRKSSRVLVQPSGSKLQFREPWQDSPHNQSKDVTRGLSTDSDYGAFGRFEGENIYFTHEEVIQIHKVYEPLYMNRIISTKSMAKSEEVVTPEVRSPEVNRHSRDLAEGYRYKQLGEIAAFLVETNKTPPSNGKVSHSDLMLYHKQVKDHKLKEKTMQKENERMIKDFPFKPKVNSPDSVRLLQSIVNSRAGSPIKLRRQPQCDSPSETPTSSRCRSRPKTPIDSSGVKRTNKLYALRKSPSTRLQKSNEDAQDEKGLEECTFKPDLSASRHIISGNTSLDNVKSADRSVERMRKAREQKEFIDWFRNQRSPYSGKKEGITSLKFGLDKSQTKANPDPHNKKKHQSSSKHKEKPWDTKFNPQLLRKYSESKLLNTDRLSNSNHENSQLQFSRTSTAKFKEDPQQENIQEQQPYLYVEVNFGDGLCERIPVYKGDNPTQLAEQFADQKNFNDHMRSKLKILLERQIQQSQ